VLSDDKLGEIIGEIFTEVLETYGEAAQIYFQSGFFSAVQLMNEIYKYNEEQKNIEQSLKVAEAFQAYKNNGGIN
jgi:hypothetical protein